MTRVAQNLLLFTAATVWGGSGCTLINDVIGSEKRDVYRFDHPLWSKTLASVDRWRPSAIPWSVETYTTGEILAGEQFYGSLRTTAASSSRPSRLRAATPARSPR